MGDAYWIEAQAPDGTWAVEKREPEKPKRGRLRRLIDNLLELETWR